MRVWAVLAISCCACGRFGFGSLPADGDVAGDDAGGDAGLADGDASLTPCQGTTHLITDNFDDNVIDTALWGGSYEDSSSRHVETSGRLEIQIGANDANDWAGYATTELYELKDDRTFVEVPLVNAQSGNAILLAWTTLERTDGPSVEFDKGTSDLIFRQRVNEAIFDLASVPYNPVMHRWWQLREKGGVTYWETSPDGVTWTIGHQIPTPGATTALITLAAGAATANPAPDLVVFDNFNGGGAPPWCP